MTGQAWQPIETAPKDGTEILAYDEMVLRVSWQDEWLSDDYAWHLGTCLMFGNSETKCSPTHWMPLPAPPEITP